MTRLAFTVAGEPKGKGRARAIPFINKDGDAAVRFVTPKDTVAAEKRVREAFRDRHPGHKPWTCAVLIRFTAVFETPVSFNKALKAAASAGKLYAVKKPDKDNIEKLIVDALNKVAWSDDQQVMGGGVKRYGSPARLEISLEPLDSPDVPPTPGERRAQRAQQHPLPLAPPRAAVAKQTKSQSPPNLKEWSPRQRKLIEAALAREAAARGQR